jgi:hypothetical protein
MKKGYIMAKDTVNFLENRIRNTKDFGGINIKLQK